MFTNTGDLADLLKLVENSNAINKSTQIYLNYIVNNLPHYIFWKDKNSVFLGCNKKFAETTGFHSPADIIGKTDYDMPWKKEESDLYIADDQAIMKSGVAKLDYEERQRQTDGSEKIMLVSKVPMFDEDNKIIGVLGIYTDITERKKMEENLRMSKEMAEVANRLKTEFIRNMEHDIRTPFCGVWALANELWEQETDLEKKENLGYITQSAKELMDYCNNILDFSKMESGKTPVLAKKFDLRALINRVVTLEIPITIIKKIKLIQEISEDSPTILVGDPNRLERILINLISNAIKFTKEGHVKIKVDVAKKSEKKIIMHFYIEDTGIGIPPDKQAFIYEKFTRGTPSNQGIYKGSGLGLYVVKQLIDDVAGEIDVTSEINKGTKFICTIPFQLPLVDIIF